MKKSKLIGVILMISSLLLQVAYAQTIQFPSEARTAAVDGYHVQFRDVTYQASDYVKVEAIPTNNGRSLAINIKNLYPGAQFSITSHVQNQGTKPIKVTRVEILPINLENKSEFILNGYDAENNKVNGGIEGYTSYLTNKYINQQILINETIPLTLKMEMKEEATKLQSESVGFEARVDFEWIVGETDTTTPEITPGGGTSITDEVIPGGEIDITDEEIPGGVKIEEGRAEDSIKITDEEIPGGSMLPKTGGVATLIVYILGIIMLGSGLMLYRKKEKRII